MIILKLNTKQYNDGYRDKSLNIWQECVYENHNTRMHLITTQDSTELIQSKKNLVF